MMGILTVQLAIEIESEDDKKFVRMVGFSSKPTQYFEYEIEGAKVKIMGRKKQVSDPVQT